MQGRAFGRLAPGILVLGVVVGIACGGGEPGGPGPTALPKTDGGTAASGEAPEATGQDGEAAETEGGATPTQEPVENPAPEFPAGLTWFNTSLRSGGLS